MSGPHSSRSDHAGRDEVLEYTAHLLNSERLRKAPVLRHLLEYLLSKVADSRTEEIKESVIAVEVFGRSLAFDGRSDNLVRVQAHRLRKLLEAYYQAEGAADPLRVSIPRGGYVPLIEGRRDLGAGAYTRPVEPDSQGSPASEDLPDGVKPAMERRAPTRHAMILALALAFALGAAAALVVVPWAGRSFGARPVDSADDLRQKPLAALWGHLLSPNARVVLSFTNPVFLWTQSGGTQVYMTYRGPISAPIGTQMTIAPEDPFVDQEIVRGRGPFYFSDSWTGTGELFAAHRLTELFTLAGKRLEVVRSRSLTYNDLHEASVIFLGSTWANELQEKFNADDTPLVCYGRERIVNRQPRAGEPTEFVPVYDPKTRELLASYVLFSVLPGLKPGTKILASAGIQTYGTGAGIEYLTSTAGVWALLGRFDPARKERLPDYFQAVIRHEMLRGEPIKASLVLARSLDRVSSPAPATSRQP
jgi:hypothetical protein